jgi:hypothetical protein
MSGTRTGCSSRPPPSTGLTELGLLGGRPGREARCTPLRGDVAAGGDDTDRSFVNAGIKATAARTTSSWMLTTWSSACRAWANALNWRSRPDRMRLRDQPNAHPAGSCDGRSHPDWSSLLLLFAARSTTVWFRNCPPPRSNPRSKAPRHGGSRSRGREYVSQRTLGSSVAPPFRSANDSMECVCTFENW